MEGAYSLNSLGRLLESLGDILGAGGGGVLGEGVAKPSGDQTVVEMDELLATGDLDAVGINFGDLGVDEVAVLEKPGVGNGELM